MPLNKNTKLVPWNKNTAKFGIVLVHKLTEEKFILRGVKGHSMFVDHEDISPEQLFSNYWAIEKNALRACAEEVIISEESPREKQKTIFQKVKIFLTGKDE